MKKSRRYVVLVTSCVGMLLAAMTAADATPPSTEELVARADLVAPEIPEPVVDEVDVAIDQKDASGTVLLDDEQITIGADDPADSIVRQRADGFQVLTVLDPGESRTTYELDVPTGHQWEQDGAQIWLLDEEHDKVGVIHAPWAVDATGRSLPTHYRLHGDTLVQYVDTSDASFPVVADPTFSIGWNWGTVYYVKFNKAEAARIGAAATVGVGAFTMTFCGLIPSQPWYAFALRASCAGVIATVSYQVRAHS